ncbi:MAG TPA: DUF169 domain-containing protein [Bryobacteraceae bacterium]|nr:DUF169 domain-containing protein [Bryobacteraceae bacterium]
MKSYSEIARSLTDSLHLTQPPVAVCLADQVPAGVDSWSGHAPAGCRFWQEAAKRVFATSAADHALCSIGLYTHSLEMSPASTADLGDALKVFADLTYVREQDIAAIPVLASKPGHVIYGPLSEIPLPPDVVLLVVQASQTLILSEASQQLESGLPPAMGRPACAIIPQARNSGRSALSLGCCGARAYLDVLTDDVALYAVPGAAIDAFADRVAALAGANEILTKFHQLRRRDVEAGKSPSIKESLAAMQAAG